MFQRPHHFEALRCKVIEGLWDGEQGREPMLDLMGDITEYCRSPELTLSCPREEILIGACLTNDFMFMDNGNAYQVSRQGTHLVLKRISTSTSHTCSTSVATLCAAASAKPWKCHYDPDSHLLYLLYENGGMLFLKRDMATAETDGHSSIPHLAACEGSLAAMTVVGDLLYVAMRFESGSVLTASIEVFSVRLGMTSEVRLVDTICGQKNDPSFFLRFNAVPGSPQAVDIVLKSANAWHSVRIDMVRSDSPMLYSSRRNELLGSPGPEGTLLQNTPGLNMIMFEEPDGYVLRRPRDLRKLATIDKCSTSLPKDTPIVFGRWSFSVLKKRPNGVNTWVHYHPYLL